MESLCKHLNVSLKIAVQKYTFKKLLHECGYVPTLFDFGTIVSLIQCNIPL